MNSELRIRIKIIAGYVITLLLSIVAVWWGYQRIILVVNENEDQNKMFNKSILASKAISALYEAEYYGNIVVQFPRKDYLSDYLDALSKVKDDLDSLRRSTISEQQLDLLVELDSLLVKKEQCIRELTEIFQSSQTENLVQRIMEDAMTKSTNKPTTRDVITRTIEKNDTIARTVVPKRTFWRRVGDVFRSDKTDPLANIQVIKTLQTDSLKIISIPNDSLRLLLGQTQDNVKAERTRNNRALMRKLQSLLTTQQDISKQIALLLGELNKEAMDGILAEMSAKRTALQLTGKIVAGIAILAVVVILLFLTFIFRDINKSGKYKRQLEEARRHAEELMNSRHRLLLNISHDIKAPLGSITGYLDLMAESEDEKVRVYTASMKASAGYMMDLLANLLEYARLETGKSVAYSSTFDVCTLFEHAAEAFLPITEHKGVAIRLRSGITLDRMVEGDAVRIRQIVMNLLSNAVKFTDKGEITLSYAVTDGQRLDFYVEDTGCGIPPEKQKDVFIEFLRTERADREGYEGNGLGLSVVKGTVELLGGSIALTSQVGKGSTFTVSLPIKLAADQMTCTQQVQPTKAQLAPCSVLLVDDDRMQLTMVSEMLRVSGHHVFTATNLHEVERMLLSNQPDLVLTDLHMGEFSGYKLLEYIRGASDPAKRVIPIIAVSASDNIHAEDLKEAGFDGFLKKPLSLKELLEIIAVQVKQATFSGVLFDAKSLLEMMDGDEAAMQQIMELFASSTRENIALLATYLEDKEHKEVKRLCHKILPMYLQLGVREVAPLLAKIDGIELDSISEEEMIGTVGEIIRRSAEMLEQLEAGL